MTSEYAKTASPYDGGKWTNPGMVALIATYCAIRGYTTLKLVSVMQGSFNVGVVASAGTHDKADCVDLSEYDWKKKNRIFRSIGGAIFHRTRAQGFSPHCHMVRMYSTAMAWLATAQDKAYRASAANGLGNLTHKDVEWMPRYRGIKHLSGPEKGAKFIATKATPGYSVPGTDPKNDKDLITHQRAKGYVISGIAGRVRCQSKDYFVVTTGNDDMTFYLVADFNAYVDHFVALKQTMVVTKDDVYGRVGPGIVGVDHKKGIPVRSKGFVVAVIGYVKTVEGTFWSSNHGTWYTGTSLAVRPPTTTNPVSPAKPLPTSHAMTLIGQNEIVNRLTPANTKMVGDWKKGLAFATRAGMMVELYKDSGVSVVNGAEAGSPADNATFAAALTKKLGGTWEHHGYGDGWDISQSINVNTDVFKVVKVGFVTMTPAGPGTSHNIAPWALLEHKASKIRHYDVSLHLIAGSGVTNDKQRGQQVHSLVPQMEKIAAGVPIVYAGDLNGYLEQASDEVGKAFKALGYTDVESTPCAGENVEWPSYNGLDASPSKNRRQLDRCFIKTSQVTARRRRVLVPLVGGKISVPKGWPSDHWAVLYDLTIHAK